MNFAQIYKDYLRGYKVTFTEGEVDNLELISTSEPLDCGITVRVTVSFTKSISNAIAGIHVLDFISINNISRKEALYKYLNELNLKHSFIKFVLDSNNKIIVFGILPINYSFEPEIVARMLLSILDACNFEYPRIMNII